MRLSFAKSFDPARLVWSGPNSPTPAICSYCSGALPEVPLMFWDSRGAAISLCGDCAERYVVVIG
jgi:hypothetical protein